MTRKLKNEDNYYIIHIILLFNVKVTVYNSPILSLHMQVFSVSEWFQVSCSCSCRDPHIHSLVPPSVAAIPETRALYLLYFE